MKRTLANHSDAVYLELAAMILDLDQTCLFEWLCYHRYAYRHTGIATGKKLAYMRWVRAGLFVNAADGIAVTLTGLLRIRAEFDDWSNDRSAKG